MYSRAGSLIMSQVSAEPLALQKVLPFDQEGSIIVS
jgi:hypothetical protein